MSGLTDIIFLLIIFFMLTSTLVAPNALDLRLPKSDSQVIPKGKSITVSVNKKGVHYVDNEKVAPEAITEVLREKLKGQNLEEATVILNLDKEVTVDNMVNILNTGSELGVMMVLGTERLN